MDARPPIAHEPQSAVPPERTEALLRVWRTIAIVAVALILAVAFGAYSRPELVLDFAGLRYCG